MVLASKGRLKVMLSYFYYHSLPWDSSPIS
jgi:hypothetical protein